MLELGSTELLIKNGARCQWAGQGKRGHICSYPPVLKQIIESDEFTEKMKSNRRVTYRRAKRAPAPRVDGVINDQAE